jgi:hypothetical protein
MKTRRSSRRGAAMSPVRRSTGETCQGHPRRRSLVTLKCRRRASRRQHKTVGSSTRQAARPAREDQRMVRSRAVPSGTGASEPQRSAPIKSIPREGRRSGRCPPASSMTALTAQTLTPSEASVEGEVVGLGVHAERATSGVAKRWPVTMQTLLIRGSGARTFMCPSSPAGATVQPRPLRRPGEQPPE